MTTLKTARLHVGTVVRVYRRSMTAVGESAFGRPIVHAPVGVVVALAFLLIKGPSSYAGTTLLTILIYAIAALGLNIPAGFGGALSLGQGAAFAVGAYTVGALTVDRGWPFWVTLPCAFAIGALLGAALGAPAGRLGDIGLALVSLGAVFVATDMIVALKSITHGVAGLSPISVISNFGSAPSYSAWLLAGLIVVSAFLTYLMQYAVRVSTLGRSAVATRDEPIGALSLGISRYRTKLAVFVLGSALGALAGGLFALMSQFIGPDAFNSQLSVILLAMIVLGGSGSLVGPLLGAVVLVVLPQELASYPHVNNIIYGLTLILIMLLRPSGLVRRTAAPTRERLINADQHPTTETSRPVRHDLELRGISRSFGGVRALEDVSISVRGGEVLALIGPNGSGKTTVINVITGMYRAAAGSVLLDGVEITRLPARRIALNGVARTFQTPKTFPALSIAEHLSLASSARGATGGGTITDPELWVRRVLNLGGIDVDDRSVMRRETRELSHGQLRFLEIAMAIRRMPRVLLLDEPAAGLSPKEIAGLEAVTRELADAGIGVLFVEHHLDLVTRLADQVVVLDLGRVIWKGKPDQLHESDAVKTAYLGVSS
jgi:branched-chain amino acid transport system permease protein